MNKEVRGIIAAMMIALPLVVCAQAGKPVANYPDKPVRMVVPFTPGASNDIIARLMGGKLGEAWGQQFVIDNRPGAGGSIGAETVAKGVPDGYTIMLTNPGPNVNNPLMSKRSTYRVTDFTHIAFIGYAPLIILANPAFPPNNPKELLDYAKANPGKINWGSSGNGSSLHIGLALFQASTGVNVQHVPYKGAAPALTDAIGGQIQLLYTTTVSGEAAIKGNRLKIIGAASDKRLTLLPNVPTLQEAGIRDAEAIVWFGISGPPGLPRSIVERINVEVNRLLKATDVKARLDQLGLETAGGTPEAFTTFVNNEAAKLARLIKAGLVQTE
jgi:tripartite-type tricarboxylate transporter receptor subunit TctC